MVIDNYIPKLRQYLNLQDATFTLVDHEDAMVAVVYKITKLSGDPLILKICCRRNDYLRELYFLNHFAGKIPVPRIIDSVPSENAILMECLPGDILKNLNDEIAFEMGALLARIHLNRTAGYGDILEDLNTSPLPHFTFKFEEGLSECAGRLPQSVIDQCRLQYHNLIYLLSSVDGPCLVHRDFRAGNVMVHEGKIQGIIDWSSGRAGFAEEDFCQLVHMGWPCKEAFLSGYSSIRPVPDYQPIMPLLRLNKAIGIVGFMVKRGMDNTPLYQYNLKYLTELGNPR